MPPAMDPWLNHGDFSAMGPWANGNDDTISAGMKSPSLPLWERWEPPMHVYFIRIRYGKTYTFVNIHVYDCI